MSPRKSHTSDATQIGAITHADTRANLPTSDAQDFVAPELERPIPVSYPRDPSLDPQLVWRGKDALDAEDLVADAPPIYIQEKIDPRVLIENLRRAGTRPEEGQQPALFDDFDGLPELDLVDFYHHEAKWSNRMILGDSLNVMASLAEREALRGKVQMIYIDPPYGIKFGSNWQASARKRDVKDGNIAGASREVEQIKAFRDTWELGIHSYLTYLRDRLMAARDLLTESGSCFVQIGDDNVHLVRSLLDEVFGADNCIATISYKSKKMPLGENFIFTAYDHVLWYGVDKAQTKFRRLYRERTLGAHSPFGYVLEPDGVARRLADQEADNPQVLPSGSRIFQSLDLVSTGRTESCVFDFSLNGQTYSPGRGRSWKTNQTGMTRLQQAGRIVVLGRTPRYALLLDDYPVQEIENVWHDTQGASDKIYVVQTAVKIIQRCLLMTTDPGDLVLDPTCGSGTTAYVSEQWGRRWITIDTSRVALALARQRLMSARYPYYLLADSVDGRSKESKLAATPLPPTEVTDDIRHGFVYQRVPHVTLGDIANNPDIELGMTGAEINAAIQRHSGFEFLYDKPFENPKKVRVAGPFTVESLSPYRSLAFSGSAVDGVGATNVDLVGNVSVGDTSFEQTILANLRTAGIQNGRKGERLTFDTVESYAAAHIQAVGERDGVTDDTPKRVGLTIGPQYGTVGPSFIKDAAREANRAGDLDLLCVLAFAFDPSVLGSGDEYVASEDGFANVAAERQLGKVPVLLVRMNADLVMGEELKKTGAGNLFTVFGEPDIAIKEEDGELRVILHGVDVYDPNTGELRSNDTDQVALWMIDTEYNDESFFVRHCYFTGGQDPFARLKRALKADIDEDAWASLYRTESRPFPRPESGRIAVKVINDYGDEVMKVFTV